MKAKQRLTEKEKLKTAIMVIRALVNVANISVYDALQMVAGVLKDK